MGYKWAIPCLHTRLVALEHSYHMGMEKEITDGSSLAQETRGRHLQETKLYTPTEAAGDCMNMPGSHMALLLCVELVTDLNPKVRFTQTISLSRTAACPKHISILHLILKSRVKFYLHFW